MKSIFFLVWWLILAGASYAQSALPVVPSTVTLTWKYPTNQYVRTYSIPDPTTGTSQNVTNLVTSFVLYRSMDLTNWTAVATAQMTNVLTVPYVDTFCAYVLQASNQVSASVFSNMLIWGPMPSRATLNFPTFNP